MKSNEISFDFIELFCSCFLYHLMSLILKTNSFDYLQIEYLFFNNQTKQSSQFAFTICLSSIHFLLILIGINWQLTIIFLFFFFRITNWKITHFININSIPNYSIIWASFERKFDQCEAFAFGVLNIETNDTKRCQHRYPFFGRHAIYFYWGFFHLIITFADFH